MTGFIFLLFKTHITEFFFISVRCCILNPPFSTEKIVYRKKRGGENVSGRTHFPHTFIMIHFRVVKERALCFLAYYDGNREKARYHRLSGFPHKKTRKKKSPQKKKTPKIEHFFSLTPASHSLRYVLLAFLAHGFARMWLRPRGLSHRHLLHFLHLLRSNSPDSCHSHSCYHLGGNLLRDGGHRLSQACHVVWT